MNEYLSPDGIAAAEYLLERAQKERDAGKAIYPPQRDILRALELTPPSAVKVVVLGQDPYHEAGQANGLAFSVNKGVALPPSLRNIFHELCADIGCAMPTSGDLTPWAERGVLLLNTVLTVEEGRANSHANWGWNEVVGDVVHACVCSAQPVVFLLWGKQARDFVADMGIEHSPKKACVVSSHPSPLGATKASRGVPAFVGSRPFSRTNQLLREMGAEPIDWTLP